MTKDVRDFKYLEGRIYEDAQVYLEKPYFLSPIHYNGVRCKHAGNINEYRINVIIERDKITSVVSIG